MRGHVFNNERVLVGATYSSLAIDAFFNMFPEETSGRISKLSYINPVVIKQGEIIELQAKPLQKDQVIELQIMNRELATDIWKPAAIGQCQKSLFETKKVNIESLKQSLTELHHIDQMYKAENGPEWGELFKTITHLYRDNRSILAKIRLPQSGLANRHLYTVSPLMTNSAYLAILSFLEQFDNEGSFLPFGINDIQFTKQTIQEDCWLLITLVKNTGDMLLFDVDVINESSETVLRYSGYSLKQLHISNQRGNENQPIKVSNLKDRIRSYVTDKLAVNMADPSKLSLSKAHIMDLGIDSSQLVALTREMESETKSN